MIVNTGSGKLNMNESLLRVTKKSYQEHIGDNRPIAIKCNLTEKHTDIS